LRIGLAGWSAGWKPSCADKAVRLLAARGADALAERLQGARAGLALERLTRAGLLRDEALVEELLAQTQLALIASRCRYRPAGPKRRAC
jgi:hypothetical protein